MEVQNNTLRRAPDAADCGHCFMETRCWPESAPRSGSVEVQREPVLRKGQSLWRQGDAYRGLFLLRSGCIKVCQHSSAGEEQVLQFALTGDLLGLEAMTAGSCDSHAVALTDAMVCRLRWPPLDTDTAQSAHIERRLLQRASSLLRQRSRAVRAADPTTALHSFLQDFAARTGQPESAAADEQRRLRLPMSRLEIGQHLGYAEETICRSFHRLQELGLATVAGRTIVLNGLVS
jgi:CRP/FNR family transcriptional regulator